MEYMGIGHPMKFHTMNAGTLQALSLHLEKGQSLRTSLRQPDLFACMCRPLSCPPFSFSSSFCQRYDENVLSLLLRVQLCASRQ